MNSNSESDLLEYAMLAAHTLEGIANSHHVPFLKPIAHLSFRILDVHKTTKANRNAYLRMLDLVHTAHCVITVIILQKIEGSLRSHQELGKFRRFFKHKELITQLETYELQLKEIVDTLKLKNSVNTSFAVALMESDTRQRHQELLSLIQKQNLSQESLLGSMKGSLYGNSSTSLLSLLPASPQIFHGRAQELEEVVSALMVTPARVVILGPGGIGKTTLAKAALHNQDIVSRYGRRYFVSCESANTDHQLINMIGSQLGFKPSQTLSRTIIQYFARCGLAILVLDNMDTPWEVNEQREKVEEFLSALSDVQELALLITMRGAER
ncbi:hypothetical protein B0H19DRAFT_1232737, partial [Mycena capillaripes]